MGYLFDIPFQLQKIIFFFCQISLFCPGEMTCWDLFALAVKRFEGLTTENSKMIRHRWYGLDTLFSLKIISLFSPLYQGNGGI